MPTECAEAAVLEPSAPGSAAALQRACGTGDAIACFWLAFDEDQGLAAADASCTLGYAAGCDRLAELYGGATARPTLRIEALTRAAELSRAKGDLDYAAVDYAQVVEEYRLLRQEEPARQSARQAMEVVGEALDSPDGVWDEARLARAIAQAGVLDRKRAEAALTRLLARAPLSHGTLTIRGQEVAVAIARARAEIGLHDSAVATLKDAVSARVAYFGEQDVTARAWQHELDQLGASATPPPRLPGRLAAVRVTSLWLDRRPFLGADVGFALALPWNVTVGFWGGGASSAESWHVRVEPELAWTPGRLQLSVAMPILVAGGCGGDAQRAALVARPNAAVHAGYRFGTVSGPAFMPTVGVGIDPELGAFGSVGVEVQFEL
jgi:hypothetical protein